METPETPPESQPETALPLNKAGNRRGMNPRSRQELLPGDHRQYKEPLLPFPGVESEDGEPEELALMRWVSKNAVTEGESEEVAAYRKWLKDDVKGFMERRSRLAEKWLEAKAVKPAAQGGKAVEDKGTAACEEMYDRLLREWGEELR